MKFQELCNIRQRIFALYLIIEAYKVNSSFLLKGTIEAGRKEVYKLFGKDTDLAIVELTLSFTIIKGFKARCPAAFVAAFIRFVKVLMCQKNLLSVIGSHFWFFSPFLLMSSKNCLANQRVIASR